MELVLITIKGLSISLVLIFVVALVAFGPEWILKFLKLISYDTANLLIKATTSPINFFFNITIEAYSKILFKSQKTKKEEKYF